MLNVESKVVSQSAELTVTLMTTLWSDEQL